MSLRRSVSVTQLARRSTPVTLPDESRIAVPPADSIQSVSAEASFSAASTGASDSRHPKPILRANCQLMSSAPSIGKRGIPIKHDSAGWQGAFQGGNTLLSDERVVEVQHTQIRHRLKHCRALVRDARGIQAQ